MSWKALIYDSSLPDSVRDALRAHKTKIIVNRKVANDLFEQLYVYRRRRIMENVSRHINEKQLEEGYDEEQLIDEVSQMISRARLKRTQEKPLVFGKKSNWKETLEKIRAGEVLKVIPTGFSVWDDVNGGLAASTVTLLTGFTGSMKSTLAEVLAVNFATQGVRVGKMSLEMSQAEDLIVRAARAARVDRTEILKAKGLSGKEWDRIERKLDALNENIASLGGCIETHTPADGITKDELFLTMEPHGYQVLMIDYVSLVKDMMDSDKFWMKLMQFTGMAKIFARRTNTRVIILVQATEENKIKLSTNMANDADVIWSIRYDEDFRSSEFMDIMNPKTRGQKAMNFPLRKEPSYANIFDVTEEELQQFKNDQQLGKLDVKNKRPRKGENEVERIQTRGKKEGKSREDVELEEYFSEASFE